MTDRTHPEQASIDLPQDEVLSVLSDGELEVHGLLPYASNATLLATVSHRGSELLSVYKPRRGERPLWDFPAGTLCLREYAAFVVDQILGWDLVPPTVLRDGPAGFGAVQLYIDEAPQVDLRELPSTHPQALRRMVVFDVITNNADRKGGHCIVDERDKLWGIDHGICFHADPKLRTILWVYAGEPIPADLLADLQTLRDADLPGPLDGVLSPEEMDALHRRVVALLEEGRFPVPGPGHRVPWPPW